MVEKIYVFKWEKIWEVWCAFVFLDIAEENHVQCKQNHSTGKMGMNPDVHSSESKLKPQGINFCKVLLCIYFC